MTEGAKQTHWTYQDSRCHMLTIDLTKRTLRPVMDKQEFPFNSGHPQTRAVEQGAVACGPGGYNIVLYMGLGIADQPHHALVVDGEIWTTGLGNGGYGVLLGDGWAKVQNNRRIVIRVWGGGASVPVEHVNRGHEGEVVAFTPRGGTNEYPRYRGKHFVSFRPETGEVLRTGQDPLLVWKDTVVLESTFDLGFAVGDAVRWKPNLGADGVVHIVSGWPQIVRGGANVVEDYHFDPHASAGPDNWFVRRNPRTGIGCSEDGKTAYMLCVEGRLPNQYNPNGEPSRGLRLKAFAETAVKHGIHDLVNMDGGGSAFQWTLDGEPVWGCYNAVGTIEGQRRAHFSAAVF